MTNQDAQGAPNQTRLHDNARLLCLLIAFGLCIFAFSNALNGEFVYDDKGAILENQLIQNPRLVWRGMTHDVWAFKGDVGTHSSYWRPTFIAWLAANWIFAGPDPKVWHTASLALHLFVIWLAFNTLARLKVPLSVAAFATWIFAVHPTRSESVTWISGSPDLLMTMFFLASVLAFLRWKESTRTGWCIFSLVLFGCALLSKESALPLSLFFIGLGWVSEPTDEKPTWRQQLLTWAPYVVVSLGWVLLRYRALGSFNVGFPDSPSTAETLASIPQTFLFYVLHTFAPTNLAVLYDLPAVTVNRLLTGGYLIEVVLTAVLVWVGIIIWRFDRFARIGLMLFILPILPAMAIKVFRHDDIVHDRYLYLPALGIALVLGSLAFRAVQSISGASRARAGKTMVVAALVLSLGLAWMTQKNNEHWMNDVELFRQAAAVGPNSAVAQVEFAERLRQAKMLDEAEIAITRGIELKSGRPNTYLIYALIARDRGDGKTAEQRLFEAVKLEPYYEPAWEQLALFEDQKGDMDRLQQVCSQAIRALPHLRAKYSVRSGIASYKQGKKQQAMATLAGVESELSGSRDPRVLEGLFLLAELQREEGQPSKASETYRKYLSLSEGFEDERTVQLRNQAVSQLGEQGR